MLVFYEPVKLPTRESEGKCPGVARMTFFFFFSLLYIAQKTWKSVCSICSVCALQTRRRATRRFDGMSARINTSGGGGGG